MRGSRSACASTRSAARATTPANMESHQLLCAPSFRSNPPGSREWFLLRAMGLMQLMPATAQHFGVTHPFYIHENVRGGVAYLAELQALFHGDLRLVMAAYAAGEKPILARRLDYSSEEVYTYVQRVAHQYRAELGRKGGR